MLVQNKNNNNTRVLVFPVAVITAAEEVQRQSFLSREGRPCCSYHFLFAQLTAHGCAFKGSSLAELSDHILLKNYKLCSLSIHMPGTLSFTFSIQPAMWQL